MKFNERLKYLRKMRDMTQNELGDALGISGSAISMYERGNREPDYETLEVIADYFNVDIGFLIGRQRTTTQVLTFEQYEVSDAYQRLTAAEKNMIRRLLGLKELTDNNENKGEKNAD